MKKVLIFISSLIICLLVPCTAFAQEYGTDRPAYIPFSGGAYVEVQSTLGRGSLVFQDIYKNDYIGFSGSGYSLCNLSNSTLTGRYITQSGQVYNCRFSSYSEAQYYYDSGVTREWRNLNISKIYNTNVNLIDDTELDRGFLVDVFNNNRFEVTVIGCLFFMCLFDFLKFFLQIRSL